MLAGFLLLLLLTGTTDGESTNSSCSYEDIFKHLKTKRNENSMTRPAINTTSPTMVYLDVLIFAILEVNEKDQKFVSYIWIDMSWRDEFISWEPAEFCNTTSMLLPTKQLWRPDLTIEEMTERDKATESPYLTVFGHGGVYLRNEMLVISTCRMRIHKFPFDYQSCNLSFKSVMYPFEELEFGQVSNSTNMTEWSRTMMQTQSEWLFINMEIIIKNANNFGINQSMLICTINMKRRSQLYVVNFMLPILFFLGLDLASFLISDSGGEKLSFKVTVLLAVTVMQLLLNEILPSSSDRIPMIALYCVGIFGLMMLSLLETILVMYLMEKDLKETEAAKEQSQSEDCGNKRGKVTVNNCFRDFHKMSHCVCDISADETPSDLLPVSKEESTNKLTEDSSDPERPLDEFREMVKTLSLVLNTRKEEAKPGYWTRMTKTINKVFFFFYIISATLFLVGMFYGWSEQ